MRILTACCLAAAFTMLSTSGGGAADGPAGLSGYLTASQLPNSTAILPRAPQPGSARYEADRKIFSDTRSLKGSDRWALARNDDVVTEQTISNDFACALGIRLNAAEEPRLTHLVSRMTNDLVRAADSAKRSNRRLRPFLIDKGETCIPASAGLAATYDYPSGHATVGWALGLALAELEPDRATAILERARAFGESRVVCGVHNASAVDAGRTEGSVVVAALHGSAEFREDLEAARAEIAKARATAGLLPAACADETLLIERPAY